MTARLLLARDAGHPDELAGWLTAAPLLRGRRVVHPHPRLDRSSRNGSPSSCCWTGCSPGRCCTRWPPPSSACAALAPATQRPALTDPARRPIGQLRTRLEYADPRPASRSLPPAPAGALQQTCGQASEAITARYFPSPARDLGHRRMGWIMSGPGAQRSDRSSWAQFWLRPAPERSGGDRHELAAEDRPRDPVHVPGRRPASYNEARMTPLTLPWQTALSDPGRGHAGNATPVRAYHDYWAHPWSPLVRPPPAPHTSTCGRSSTHGGGATVAPAPPSPLTWYELRGGADAGLRTPSYLTETPPDHRGRPAGRGGVGESHRVSPETAAAASRHWVRERVEYVPGATECTDERAGGMEARRKGVCQDIAHLTVGLLRGTGASRPLRVRVPASAPRGGIGQAVAGQSHAWAGATGRRLGPAADPTNQASVGEGHVVAARGRDHATCRR